MQMNPKMWEEEHRETANTMQQEHDGVTEGFRINQSCILYLVNKSDFDHWNKRNHYSWHIEKDINDPQLMANQLIECRKRIEELEKEVRFLQKSTKARPDLLEQNDIGRKALERIFGIKPDDDIDTAKLDGLLKDYVDKDQDSMDLIRSIRGG